MPRFQIGEILVTPGATFFLDLENISLTTLIARHANGDWGELPGEDAQANEAALKHGGRLFSRYVYYGEPVYVITDADRSLTTILLPNEY